MTMMKKLLSLLLFLLPFYFIKAQTSGMTELKKITIAKSFKSQVSRTYTFYLSRTSVKPVKLVLRGTDYNKDYDGDYTDFRITVNGKKVIDIKPLTNYGLGKNGTYKEAVITISSYIKYGTNTIKLENTEDRGQVDYVYLSWMKVMITGSSYSPTNTVTNTSISLNVKKPIYHKFKQGVKKTYSFYLSSTSNTSNAKLILTGYDNDYDNDGDYTEASLKVNGSTIFSSAEFKTKGLGYDNKPKDLKFDIGSYLKSGTNKIEIANTEVSGQLDYFYLTAIKVESGESKQVISQSISLNSSLDVNMKFTPQTVLNLNYYQSGSNSSSVILSLYGTDVNADNDKDFTDFAIKVNNSSVIYAKSLTEKGFGKDGSYATAEYDISSYLRQGSNTISLYNTEVIGQVDYVYLKSVELGAQSIINQPPVITVTNPDLSRGFKVVTQNMLTVEGIATDDDGIKSVIVNGINAQVSLNGNFNCRVPVNNGSNNITVIAMDKNNVAATKSFTVNVNQQGQVVNNHTKTKNNLGEGKFYAIIIGVSDYADPQIPDLMGEPTKDAQKLYDILTQKYVFEAQNVKLLKNPSYKKIIRSFDDFAKKITDKDNLLIFYAGHGDYDEKTNIGYWLPADAEMGYTDAWLYNSVLVDNIKKINSKHTLLLADACFSGSIFQTRSLLRNASVSVQKKYELKSRNAITSGTLKTVPNKSVFFKYLSDRLQNNEKQFLTASELFQKIEIPVGNNSPNMPQFGDIKYVGDEGGDFIFIKR